MLSPGFGDSKRGQIASCGVIGRLPRRGGCRDACGPRGQVRPGFVVAVVISALQRTLGKGAAALDARERREVETSWKPYDPANLATLREYTGSHVAPSFRRCALHGLRQV